MGRFAHLADVHLGYQKHENLVRIERDVFSRAVSECISRKVDFVLVCGDLFHINIPDMSTNVFAFEKFRQLKEAGIPVYAVYGSHDFSPTVKSIIDLLAAADLITKVTVQTDADEGIGIGFVTDPGTGAKIAGLPGLKTGMDRKLYENLDRESLEAEVGFKIFMFHGAIGELLSLADQGEDSMPLSLLPRNFAYYAGGHIHRHKHEEYPKYPHVVYPGTIFAGYHKDLEENARGAKRGLIIADFDDAITCVKFVELGNARYEIIEMQCENRDADSVNAELCKRADSIEPGDRIIIIKLAGELSTGKTANVDTGAVRRSLRDAGALEVIIHKNQLTSREYSITAVKGENREEIAQNVFAENIGEVGVDREELVGEVGVRLARDLLSETEQPKQSNENSGEYERRIAERALQLMGLNPTELNLGDS